jgi:hypothetical protein
MSLLIVGLDVTLSVGGQSILTQRYNARMDEFGDPLGLNYGMLGIGSRDAALRVADMTASTLV